jgi:hypothetical protein
VELRQPTLHQKGMRRFVCAVVLVVVAAGCSSSHSSARSSSSSTTVASLAGAESTTPKGVAIALGQRLLDRVVLPSGSRPLTTPEPAALGGFVPQPGVGNLLFAHRVFSVDETFYNLWHFLQAHIPRGFRTGGDSSGSSGGAQMFGVEYDLSVLQPNIGVAELLLRMTPGASGGVVLRIDSEVAWTAPRPADELVSPRDHVMILSTIHAYEPGKPVGKHIVVTDARLVDPIVKAFNSARVEAPTGPLGTHECGFVGSNAIVYRIAFTASPTATPDVVATLQCYAVSVTVNGRAAPPLENISEQAWNDIDHDLGIAEAYPTPTRTRR